MGRPGPAVPGAYCRWRLVEAMLGGTAPVADGLARVAREAHQVAYRLGPGPLRRELELLAQRGRLDLAGPPPPMPADPIAALGLTDRECQVLRLLGRGYTTRQIAAELTISVKTASVHVSHILTKLEVSRRTEAAAIAHRFS